MTLRQFFFIWALCFVTALFFVNRIKIKHEVTITFTRDTLPVQVTSNVEPFLSIWATRPYIEVNEVKNIEEP